MTSLLHRAVRKLSHATEQHLRSRDGTLFLEGDPGRTASQGYGRVPRGLSAASDKWVETRVLWKRPGGRYLEVCLTLDLSWRGARGWEYAKLYYAVGDEPFSEERTATFRLGMLGVPQTIRLPLPAVLREATRIRLRVDPNPLSSDGHFTLHSLRCIHDADGSPLNHSANLQALKEHVRKEVARSEREQRGELPHLPHSLSLELTPRCNFTCSHCSSHGTPELHRQHNRAAELSREHLEHLGRDVFPSLTSVGIVGRGEPLAVSRQLWDRFCELLLEHEVFVAPVSNGSLLQDRIGPALLPRLDALTVSIDGATEETFARNRGGASLSNVMKNVAHFQEMRKASRLARAPRLGFSWTLKKNNIAEFPRFIEMIAELDADFVYARHLLTFFKRDAGESLVAARAFANPHLRKAYALMEKFGIRSDCPPILEEAPAEARGEAPASAPSKGCMFIWRTAVLLSDGEIPTCSAPFAAIAGHLRDKRFGPIWNGDVLRGVRQTLNGPGEWEQCRNCWYREGHYQEQRAQAAQGGAYDLQQAAQFTEKSWDFTDKEADLSRSLNRK